MSETMITNFVFPILMIFLGYLFGYSLLKDSTTFNIGYRSYMSMKSDELWDISQKLAGRIFILAGLFNILVNIILFLSHIEVNLFYFELLTWILSMCIIEIHLYYYNKKGIKK